MIDVIVGLCEVVCNVNSLTHITSISYIANQSLVALLTYIANLFACDAKETWPCSSVAPLQCSIWL